MSSKEEEEQKKKEEDDNMTPEQRLSWLRERGVQVEIPGEEKQKEELSSGGDDIIKEVINYVLIPHDSSKPLQELSFTKPYNNNSNDDDNDDSTSNTWSGSGGDLLVKHLQPAFSSTQNLDLSLLQESAVANLSSEIKGNNGEVPKVSEETLKKVASDGQVEIFNLVHATPSNKYTGINIYLDEIGAFKRLPLNQRASEYAAKCGYNPPPQFYGDVFLGRIQMKPKLQNLSFRLGLDTSLDDKSNKWLVNATSDNLSYQNEFNKMTGRKDEQPNVDGTDGKTKKEEHYTWVQTEEEVELTVPLPDGCTSKDVYVKFTPRAVQYHVKKQLLQDIKLFDGIDIDGCTWTIEDDDNNDNNNKKVVVITCEKNVSGLWPRITY